MNFQSSERINILNSRRDPSFCYPIDSTRLVRRRLCLSVAAGGFDEVNSLHGPVTTLSYAWAHGIINGYVPKLYPD